MNFYKKFSKSGFGFSKIIPVLLSCVLIFGSVKSWAQQMDPIAGGNRLTAIQALPAGGELQRQEQLNDTLEMSAIITYMDTSHNSYTERSSVIVLKKEILDLSITQILGEDLVYQPSQHFEFQYILTNNGNTGLTFKITDVDLLGISHVKIDVSEIKLSTAIDLQVGETKTLVITGFVPEDKTDSYPYTIIAKYGKLGEGSFDKTTQHSGVVNVEKEDNSQVDIIYIGADGNKRVSINDPVNNDPFNSNPYVYIDILESEKNAEIEFQIRVEHNSDEAKNYLFSLGIKQIKQRWSYKAEVLRTSENPSSDQTTGDGYVNTPFSFTIPKSKGDGYGYAKIKVSLKPESVEIDEDGLPKTGWSDLLVDANMDGRYEKRIDLIVTEETDSPGKKQDFLGLHVQQNEEIYNISSFEQKLGNYLPSSEIDFSSSVANNGNLDIMLNIGVAYPASEPVPVDNILVRPYGTQQGIEQAIRLKSVEELSYTNSDRQEDYFSDSQIIISMQDKVFESIGKFQVVRPEVEFSNFSITRESGQRIENGALVEMGEKLTIEVSVEDVTSDIVLADGSRLSVSGTPEIKFSIPSMEYILDSMSYHVSSSGQVFEISNDDVKVEDSRMRIDVSSVLLDENSILEGKLYFNAIVTDKE